MPIPTESLTPQSTDQEIKDAINATVRQLVDEGKTPEEAVAAAIASARQAAGRIPGAQGRVTTNQGGLNAPPAQPV